MVEECGKGMLAEMMVSLEQGDFSSIFFSERVWSGFIEVCCSGLSFFLYEVDW